MRLGQYCTSALSLHYLSLVSSVTGTGDGDTLFLAAADVDAALADLRVVAGRQHVQVGQELALLEDLRETDAGPLMVG